MSGQKIRATAKAAKAKPVKRGRGGSSVNQDRLFAGRPGLRMAYESALFAQEAARLIREMRLGAGLRQGDLAGRLGVSQPRVARLERVGSGDGPSYAMMRRIAVACEIEWTPPVALAARDR